jgi:ribosomal protein L22, bacterial type
MQQAKAHARYIRIAPRKVRLVIDLIRGKAVGEAISILRHTPKAASPVVEKLLNSAVANAEHNYSMDPNKLFISEAYVNPGPILKRFLPRSHGRASRINKRTSHITLVVSEKVESAKAESGKKEG